MTGGAAAPLAPPARTPMLEQTATCSLSRQNNVEEG